MRNLEGSIAFNLSRVDGVLIPTDPTEINQHGKQDIPPDQVKGNDWRPEYHGYRQCTQNTLKNDQDQACGCQPAKGTVGWNAKTE